jgi:N-acyl-D-aspartate/D-glutamate deacylase
VLDLLIRNAVILDGSGGKQFRGDVAVFRGRIQDIVSPGDLMNTPVRHEVDAAGACLAPGFIDSHTHSDIALLAEPDAAPKVSQGVTTEVIGNCGWSVVPAGYPRESDYRRVGQAIFGYPDTPWEWRDMHGYFDALSRRGTAVNIAALAGHGALRAAVMGFDERPPSESELAQMRYLLAEALQQGAIGLSSGLAYAPGCYAATDELIELAEVVAEHRGLYATHLRDQVDGLVESVQEALQIGREANIPVLISHHKTVGRNNFGKVQVTLGMLDEMHADGVPTYSDIYPYLAGSSTMLPLLPPWVLVEQSPPLSESGRVGEPCPSRGMGEHTHRARCFAAQSRT